jgi:opacity protein-like surface antigen
MKQGLIAIAALGMFSIGAQAMDVAASADLGTTGVGVHVTVPVQKQLNARFGINGLNYSYDGSTSAVDYNFKLKLNTVDALVDWYPMAGAFRLTGGAVYNGNKIIANGRPNAAGTYTINGRTFTARDVGSLDGRIDFRKLAPYLGIGWGNAIAREKTGFGFTADLGVLFQGSPRTSLSANCGAGVAALCSEIASSVAAETVRLNDEVKDFKAYPVARIGITYRF